jgi:hypothetical protein
MSVTVGWHEALLGPCAVEKCLLPTLFHVKVKAINALMLRQARSYTLMQVIFSVFSNQLIYTRISCMLMCALSQKGKMQLQRENEELRHKLGQMECGSADGASTSTTSWESEQRLLGSRQVLACVRACTRLCTRVRARACQGAGM